MLYAEKSMQPSTTKSIRKRGRLIGGNFSKEVEFEQKAKKKKKKCYVGPKQREDGISYRREVGMLRFFRSIKSRKGKKNGLT